MYICANYVTLGIPSHTCACINMLMWLTTYMYALHMQQPRPSVLAQPQETDGSQMWHSHTHSHIHQPIGSRRQRYQTHSGIPESQVSSEFLSSPLANLLPGLGQHSNVSRVQSAPTSANQHVSGHYMCAYYLPLKLAHTMFLRFRR